MIIILSCSIMSSLIIYYFHKKTKNNDNKNEIKNKLPQINGCNHKKKGNSYFYKDKVYCKFCWFEINNSLLYENNNFIV